MTTPTFEEVESLFSDAIEEAGYGRHHVPANGYINLALNGESDEKGYARLVCNGDKIYGWVKDRRDPENKLFKWRYKNGVAGDPVEKKKAKAKVQQDSLNLYHSLPKAKPDHPYLVRKKIKDPNPLRWEESSNTLVVPIYDAKSGSFIGIERIDQDGEKLVPKDGSVAGGCVIPGSNALDDLNKGKGSLPFHLGEGFATAYSIGSSLYQPVIAARYAANLVNVAKAMHERDPLRPIVAYGDNGDGSQYAIKAALEVGRVGKVCFPPPHYGDFNDQYVAEGPEAVAKWIEANTRVPEAHEAADKDIAKINETYALALVGGSAAIMKFKPDSTFDLLKVGSFSQWFANQSILRPNSDGGSEGIQLAKYWLTHKERRQYEGIVFKPKKVVPGHYNLWGGFSVEPKQGDYPLFKSHLQNVFGDDFEWVFAWFAQMVQHPEMKPGTSIVLRGKQGVGKTKIGQVFGSVFFELHYVLVADPRFVVGRFNSHLVCCILLHADEAFWAGDKQSEGKLKDLITGNRYYIEFKGKEPVAVDNNIRLFVCGNQDWVVPAGYDERRFAVWDVNEKNQRNYAFFDAIDKEMDNGGREALLYDLLNFDLSKVQLREIPKTAALLEQKVASQDDKQGWWLDTLMRGELPAGCIDTNHCPKDKLFERYIYHSMKVVGSRRRSIETSLGMFLNKVVPGLKHHKLALISSPDPNVTPPGEGEDVYGRAYEFPSLRECRAAYVKLLQQSIDWDENDEWSHEVEVKAAIKPRGAF
jgi:phage/plasmid primase-like uncharacterized protein